MDVFDEMGKALSDGQPNAPILAFGNYRINKWLGKGEQGVVVRAQGPVGKAFAVKFFRPLRNNTAPDDAIRGFQREIETLAKLDHGNIVRVYTGGTAGFSSTWTVREGYTVTPSENDVHYYLMDYIDKRLDDMFEELRGNLQLVASPSRGPADVATRQKAQLFEQMVVQLSGAMNYYHQQGTTHKDIKPENIRFRTQDSTFVLVDFGFARHLGSTTQDEQDIHKVRCLDLHAVMAGDYVRGDIGALAMILRCVVPKLGPIYQGWRYDGLMGCLARALSPDLTQRYQTAAEFREQLRRFFVMFPAWNLTLTSNECLTPSQFGRFSSKLRIPVSGSILLTKEIASIIDAPEFQRLRGVRQLGPTIFVFPGANNTRFEHSLGTYDLALRYLERVLRNPHGRHIDEQLEHSVKLVVLSALLHDIGHYPYSHWVEEIDEFPNGVKFRGHERRAKDFITKGTLAKLISAEWEIEPEEVACVISEENLETGPGLLASSFISSAIDVDKVDYLVRDSIHCGVDYGRGIDVERLFDSLYVDVEKMRLCITDKGLPSLLSLLTCRNIMYQAVYWHKTVRACEAMFKRFFYEFVGGNLVSNETIEHYLSFSDDAFTKALYDACGPNEQLRGLMAPFVLQGRSIYKPAYIFSEGQTADEPSDTKAFFGQALQTNSYRRMVDMANALVRELKKDIPDLQPLEVLLETTPTKQQHTKYDLQALRVWHSRRRGYRSLPSSISDVNDYLDKNRQAFLFCHPRHYEQIVDMSMGKRLNQLLSKI